MSLLLSFEVWFIAALLLVALDVMLGLDFILLSFGIGAAVTGSSLLLKDALPMPFTGSWEALLTFGCLANAFYRQLGSFADFFCGI